MRSFHPVAITFVLCRPADADGPVAFRPLHLYVALVSHHCGGGNAQAGRADADAEPRFADRWHPAFDPVRRRPAGPVEPGGHAFGAETPSKSAVYRDFDASHRVGKTDDGACLAAAPVAAATTAWSV